MRLIILLLFLISLHLITANPVERDANSAEEPECAVCFQPLAAQEAIAPFLCSFNHPNTHQRHSIHRKCFRGWCTACVDAKKMPTCPLCRANIDPDLHNIANLVIDSHKLLDLIQKDNATLWATVTYAPTLAKKLEAMLYLAYFNQKNISYQHIFKLLNQTDSDHLVIPQTNFLESVGTKMLRNHEKETLFQFLQLKQLSQNFLGDVLKIASMSMLPQPADFWTQVFALLLEKHQQKIMGTTALHQVIFFALIYGTAYQLRMLLKLVDSQEFVSSMFVVLSQHIHETREYTFKIRYLTFKHSTLRQ